VQYAFYAIGLPLWAVAIYIGRPIIMTLRSAPMQAEDPLSIAMINNVVSTDLMLAGTAAICGTLFIGFGAIIEAIAKQRVG